jgi:penicillin-binding protein 2
VLEQENPVPGEDLQLHLDLRLQRKAHELLEGQRGTIIAIEPATGGILALASVPSFDANKFVTGISVKDYRELSTSIDKPLFNRALRGQYPPGSTIKPMMAVAVLDSGAATREKEIWDPGYFQLREGGRRYRDWKRTGHGWVDLMEAVAESCDTYFYEMSVEMGVDTMHRYLSAFGFGEDATLDVSGALEGILPSREWKRANRNEPWYPGDSVNMSIGQGFFLSTPLQLATATSLIANRGVWVEPRLLKDIKGERSVEDFLPEQTYKPLELNNPDDWEYVIDTMEEVMHGARGTARRAGAGASYRMAGKTGTAQVFSLGQDEEYDAEEIRERLRDHALFVGFAPTDEPKIAVAVIVENGGGGSAVAAPVARELFDAWLEDFPAAEHAPLIEPASNQGEL